MAAWSETLTRLGLQLLKPRLLHPPRRRPRTAADLRRRLGRARPGARGRPRRRQRPGQRLSPRPANDRRRPGYLFCFWNVENFFDDREEKDPMRADAEFDRWFAEDKEALALKLKHLSKTLVKLNDGRGPDILALAEVESERAAELLRDALNRELGRDVPPYKNVVYRDPKGGRNIANAVITRLPVVGDKSRLHGSRQRILEVHINVDGHDLVVMASHWTSRVSDGEGEGRIHYAERIYGAYKAMFRTDPKVSFLVCGDFNDPPDAESVVRHLHAIGDMKAVKASGRDEPLLFNLFADKADGKTGTHNYRGRWWTFDQIAVSPGMLEGGRWTCDPASAHIVNDLTADRQGRPERFGGPRDKGVRGYSDHFPVTVRLQPADRR